MKQSTKRRLAAYMVLCIACGVLFSGCSSNDSTHTAGSLVAGPSDDQKEDVGTTQENEFAGVDINTETLQQAADAYRRADYEETLRILNELNSSDPQVAKVREIVEVLQSLPVNVVPESFSGDVQIYGNENLEITPDTFLVPFLNTRSGELHLQVGTASLSEDLYNPWWSMNALCNIAFKPEAGETVSWDTAEYYIYDFDDTMSRFVHEGLLVSDNAHDLLRNLGNSASGTAVIRFTDSDHHQDYTVRDEELQACKVISEYDQLWQEGRTIFATLGVQ